MHKGFTLFHRRFILPELREAVRSTGADLVVLQEVHGSHQHHAERHPKWPQTPQYELSRYPWSHLSDHAPLVAQVTL